MAESMKMPISPSMQYFHSEYMYMRTYILLYIARRAFGFHMLGVYFCKKIHVHRNQVNEWSSGVASFETTRYKSHLVKVKGIVNRFTSCIT